ncbi:MAG: hypothetical protein N2544_14340 [Burkholderiales bacterium]|nr:hypothetical protein [Burkholderiales bacterium]
METATTPAPAGPPPPLVKLTHVIYGLYAASFFVPFVWLVGIIMAYVKRDEARGSFLESHYTWLIRTFWWGLAGGVLGGLTVVVFGLGFVVLAAVVVWVVYRIVKGWLALNDGRAIANPEKWV